MASTWDDKLLLGVREMDAQHKEYFRRTDQLMELCLADVPPREFIKTFDFLRAYVQFHFSHEEGLMAEHAYPEMAFHQSQHRWFAGEVDVLTSAAQAGDVASHSLKLNALLIDWFRSHIQKVDRKLALYLIERTKPAPKAKGQI